MSASVFDRDGEWEIRTTIYRNGRRVATADALGDDYDFAVQTVVTNLERRDIQMHVPKRRRPRRVTEEQS